LGLKSSEAFHMGEARIPCAMTIAGSDSGGGAGVEADLKTFSALGVYGTCVITAITAQNTRGVYDIFCAPPELVKRQIEVVLEDISVGAAKTGMIYSEQITEVVSEILKRYKLRVVVDPVFRAGTGAPLISEKAKKTLIRLIVPQACVVTPNIPEAEEIADTRIENLEDAKKAAQRIAGLGAEAVVVKGGHLKPKERKVYDVLYSGGTLKVFEKPRLEVESHGSGCVFSAAITAYLALGEGLVEAVGEAEEFMETSIKHSLMVGRGRVPVNPMAQLYNRSEMFCVLEDVEKAARIIEANPEFLPFIAEVGTQVAMALPCPSNEKDVAAIEGRIMRLGERARAVGSVQFGASRHIASMILSVMKFNPHLRAGLNLHYDPRLVEAFRKVGSKVSSFNRSIEPGEVKSVEGRSVPWGTEQAIKSLGRVPDMIFDEGEIGKEPMIRVLGRTATESVDKALKAVRLISSEHRE